MVPVAGLEPARHRWRWILSPLRLPFHHTGGYPGIIHQVFENSKQTLGVPRIVAVLREKGYTVSNRFVSSIMKENGWFCVGSKSREIYYREIMMKRNKRKKIRLKGILM